MRLKGTGSEDAPFALLMVCVLGLVPSNLMSIRSGKLALFELAMMAVAASLVSPRLLRWAAWYVIAGFAVVYNSLSMVYAWRLVLACLTISAIALIGPNEGRLLRLWRWLTAFHTSFMLSQAVGFDPIFTDISPRSYSLVAGFMDSPHLAGAYTAMTLPLFSNGRWRWFLLPTLLAIGLTRSAGAVMAATALLAVMAVRKWDLSKWHVLGGAAVLLGLYWQIEPLADKFALEKLTRVKVWMTAFKILLFKWWLLVKGFGPGQFSPAFHGITVHMPDITGPDLSWRNAHSEPVQLLFEQGLIGLGLWVAIARRWLRGALDSDYGLIAVGWLLCSLFTFTAHVACLAAVGIVCAGMLEAAAAKKDARSGQQGIQLIGTDLNTNLTVT